MSSVWVGTKHNGVYTSSSGKLIAIGFCYDNGFQSIADQLTNNPQELIEILQSVNGDYAFFAETDDYYAVVTDPWKTKHIWVSLENKNLLASNTPASIRQQNQHAYPVDPNTVVVVDKKDFSVKKYTNRNWNLKQTVTNHNAVFDVLERSVARRYNSESIATLSSGYDSGVIACALHNLGHKKFSVSFASSEDKTVLGARLKLHGGVVLPESRQLTEQEKQDISSLYVQRYALDASGEGLARVCKYMNKIGKTNILAGNSGDELYADYGYLGKQLGEKSLFGGWFPDDLELVWPWHDYMNRQSGLISRLDLVAGYFGIQHKEPLLDVELVQAWLNTTAELKNRRYKNWMYEYMMEHNYPILEDVKIGFGNDPKNLN